MTIVTWKCYGDHVYNLMYIRVLNSLCWHDNTFLGQQIVPDVTAINNIVVILRPFYEAHVNTIGIIKMIKVVHIDKVIQACSAVF